MRAFVLCGALLALAACDSAAPPAAPVKATARATATATAAARAVVIRNAIVDAAGIGLGKNAGTAAHFPFGSARGAVEQAAERWLGAPGTHSRFDECGAGPMEFSRYGGLTLNFQDGKFTGWMLKEDPRAVTSDGIGPGAFMRDLEVTRSVSMVPDSTLDGEFTYIAADGQQICGFAVGKGRDAKIASLYAGLTCFFR